MTPETVIYRYLRVANTEPIEVSDLVQLIGTDADLLGHWLDLKMCPTIAVRVAYTGELG